MEEGVREELVFPLHSKRLWLPLLVLHAANLA